MPMRLFVKLATLLMFAAWWFVPAFAQTSNQTLLMNLTTECGTKIPIQPNGIVWLPEKSDFLYLQHVFLSAITNQGTPVFLSKTDAPQGTASFRFKGENINVRYFSGKRRGTAKRVVSVQWTFDVVDPIGKVLATDVCVQKHEDQIALKDLKRVQDPQFPETIGEVPVRNRPSWVRIGILSTAIGITAYLLFTVRSSPQSSN